MQLIHGAPVRNTRVGTNPVDARNQHMNYDQDNSLFALRPTSRQQFSNSSKPLKNSSSNRKKKLQTPHSMKQESSTQSSSSLEELFNLLNIMAKSYSHLCKFDD
eukprot:UN00417